MGERTARVLLILSFSLCALGQNSKKVTASETHPHDSSLKFRLYQDYLIAAQGSIGNLNNANLLIDTGSDSTILNKGTAQTLHLRLQQARVGTIERQSVSVSRAVLPSCKIGPIHCLNYKVLVGDLSFLQRGLGVEIDAIIGLDLLSSLNFTVDYRAQRIAFTVPQTPLYEVAFTSGPPLISVPMALNGRPMQMLVDTAASSLMIFKTRWPEGEQAFFLRPKEEVRYSTNVAGEFARHRLDLEAVTFGSLELGHQNAYLLDDRDNTHRFDGLFNPALLGLQQVSFDFERNRLGWER